jgi:hypothetical protein
MAYTVVIHLLNEDPICGEVDQLPGAQDTNITLNNPRRRDGKDVQYLANDIISVIWPINQISFIEITPSAGEEEIITFVRD